MTLKYLELVQVGPQLLRRLEMDNGKSHLLRLLNVCQGVVNEETFPCRSSNLIEHDLKDPRVWFDVPDFS